MRIWLCLMLLTLPALSKAYHATRREMVGRAAVIAIVEIDKVESSSHQGKHWTYSQKAEARLVRALKGKPSSSFVIWGGENFECSQVTLSKGTCLVFLEAEGEGYRGCNWGASCLPVVKERLKWLTGADSRQIDGESTLPQVEQDIAADLKSH
jgi:hypothetical protein